MGDTTQRPVNPSQSNPASTAPASQRMGHSEAKQGNRNHMPRPPSSSLMEQKEKTKREEWRARAVSFLVFIGAAPNTVHSAHAHARPSSQQHQWQQRATLPVRQEETNQRRTTMTGGAAHRMGKADDDDDTE
ncbi:hypothetical protein PTSG_03883 [Salpingoeca rosetta]|uniref:Uncharacterized protein n=1 Tax=Salpingoeca rosetta (strain ATCC 50818 / BSB-021) TaxID=946362 RepID=F2U5N6_SALR5|nr:uncharacterized protein PTSG_03883 [Salpingoeca rosetta]EGD83253.1 hypothetical protein PTSG_03883 [Salpingoeca rosetta]|eukprot:XP_004995617.1 hypothetical protein PTSG_03883 [Salpingoeca rosetta]